MLSGRVVTREIVLLDNSAGLTGKSSCPEFETVGKP